MLILTAPTRIALITGLLCTAALLPVHAGFYSQADDTRVAAPEEREAPGRWRCSMNLGGTFIDGNVENEMISLGISSSISISENNELFFDADGIYSDFNNTVVLDKQKASLLYAYKIRPHWNIFYYTTHARNRFLTLDYRMTHAVGICHHGFVPGLDLSLISLGILDEREWWDDDATDDTLRAAMMLHAKKTISDHAFLGLQGDYMPSLADSGDYRLYGEAYLEFKVTDEVMSFRITLSQEYDSRPREGIEKSDTAVMSAIIFKFAH